MLQLGFVAVGVLIIVGMIYLRRKIPSIIRLFFIVIGVIGIAAGVLMWATQVGPNIEKTGVVISREFVPAQNRYSGRKLVGVDPEHYLYTIRENGTKKERSYSGPGPRSAPRPEAPRPGDNQPRPTSKLLEEGDHVTYDLSSIRVGSSIVSNVRRKPQ